MQAEKFVRLCGGGVGNMVLTKSKVCIRLHALVSVNACRRSLTLCASAFFSQTIKHTVQDGPQTAQRHNDNG